MQTKWIKAERITVTDQLVTGGDVNPLRLTDKDVERRRAWDVTEVRSVPVQPTGVALVGAIVDIASGNPGPATGRRVELRCVIRGGGQDGADWWRTFTLDGKTKVRVAA